jgi:hypothetical protein
VQADSNPDLFVSTVVSMLLEAGANPLATVHNKRPIDVAKQRSFTKTRTLLSAAAARAARAGEADSLYDVTGDGGDGGDGAGDQFYDFVGDMDQGGGAAEVPVWDCRMLSKLEALVRAWWLCIRVFAPMFARPSRRSLWLICRAARDTRAACVSRSFTF